jgi:AAA+ ATPase superfamily predicted ATPase
MFIEHQEELKRLSDLTHSPNSKLVVIKGRRRIGKSRLASCSGKTVNDL